MQPYLPLALVGGYPGALVAPCNKELYPRGRVSYRYPVVEGRCFVDWHDGCGQIDTAESELAMVFTDALALHHAKMFLARQFGVHYATDVSFWKVVDTYETWTESMRPYVLIADGCYLATFADSKVPMRGLYSAFRIPNLSLMRYEDALIAACEVVHDTLT